jgi:hypothetical protein
MSRLERTIYNFIPREGRYISDIDERFRRHRSRTEAVLARFVATGIIKRAGCELRPMYVRMAAAKAFRQSLNLENHNADRSRPETARRDEAGPEPTAAGT